METGPDTLTEEQTEWLAMRAACLSEDNFDLEALRNLPPPPFPLPSWAELGRPDLKGYPPFITTAQGTTLLSSLDSTPVKKTSAGSDGVST